MINAITMRRSQRMCPSFNVECESGSMSVALSSTLVEFSIAAQPPKRLDKALARDVPEAAALSRTRLAALLADGAVRVNGAVVTSAKASVNEGDAITIDVPMAEEVDVVAEDIPLEILYEDDDLVVVNKPVGMVVHPAPGTPSGTLVNALLGHFGGALSGIGGEKRPGIVHRIDKDTSGLLVVAKSDAAHHRLAAQFEKHTVHRRYLALCHGVPEQSDPRLHGVRGTNFESGNVLKITTQLTRHKTDRQKQAVVFDGGRHAVTRAHVLERYFGAVAALVRCQLETGRTHQIRVHMAHVGHGLIGDQTYGGRRKLPKTVPEDIVEAIKTFPRQALHAAELGFEHPISGEEMMFTASMPDDMERLVDLLRAHSGVN